MKKAQTLILVFITSVIFQSCSEDTIDSYGNGDITGKVVMEGNNTPVGNVKISTNPSSSTVFTDENGEFVLAGIPEGEYSVEARKDGLLTAFEGATVISNSSVNVIFELSVETANNRQPATPELISPEDNAQGLDLTAEFTWTATDPDNDDLIYQLELRNNLNDEVQTFENISDTSYTVGGLNYGLKYFWQVKVSDSINPTVISEVHTFYTKEAPSNSLFFVRVEDGNNIIYALDESGEESRLTELNRNSFRPRKNTSVGKLAFLSDVNSETQLFTMNPDGSDKKQVTSNIPIKTIDKQKVGYSWSRDGTYLLYPSFDKLYRTNVEGGGKEIVYTAESGRYILDVQESNDGAVILLLTTDINGNSGEIFLIDRNGKKIETIVSNVEGTLDGIDLSVNKNLVLYTRDVSGFSNAGNRQLNAKIFIYSRTNGKTFNMSEEKTNGTNDLDPRFSPDEASIFFVNTSNTGNEPNAIFKLTYDEDFNAANTSREQMIEDAYMPDYE